jgi:hypothetical protein
MGRVNILCPPLILIRRENFSMGKVNSLVGNGYFSKRDIYGDRSGISTLEESAPEQQEQEALANEESGTANPKVNSKGILLGLGIILGLMVLLQIGGLK